MWAQGHLDPPAATLRPPHPRSQYTPHPAQPAIASSKPPPAGGHLCPQLSGASGCHRPPPSLVLPRGVGSPGQGRGSGAACSVLASRAPAWATTRVTALIFLQARKTEDEPAALPSQVLAPCLHPRSLSEGLPAPSVAIPIGVTGSAGRTCGSGLTSSSHPFCAWQGGPGAQQGPVASAKAGGSCPMDLNPLAPPEKADFGPGRCQQGDVWGRRHLVVLGALWGAPRAGIKLRVTGQPAWLAQDGGTDPCPAPAPSRGALPPTPGAPQTARGSPPPSLTPAFNPPGAPGVAARLRPGLGGSRQGSPPVLPPAWGAAAQSSYSCQRL